MDQAIWGRNFFISDTRYILETFKKQRCGLCLANGSLAYNTLFDQ